MRLLYHLILSPFSRKVRVVLGEKDLQYDLRAEKVWQRRPEFLALNPAAQVPVLVELGSI
jgi:glutathione S-transferase